MNEKQIATGVVTIGIIAIATFFLAPQFTPTNGAPTTREQTFHLGDMLFNGGFFGGQYRYHGVIGNTIVIEQRHGYSSSNMFVPLSGDSNQTFWIEGRQFTIVEIDPYGGWITLSWDE